MIVDDEPQTQAELEAQYGPDSPVVAAQGFFEALRWDENLDAAYPFMTPELRRDRTDVWVEGNSGHPALAGLDLEEVAEGLAELDSDHALWPAFEKSSVESFIETYSFIDPDSYGFASRPRPTGVDQELVILVKGDPSKLTFDQPTLISGAQFIMERHGDRWLVGAFSRAFGPSEMLSQGRSREDIVDEIVASKLGDHEEAEEIFDRSLAAEQ